MTKTVIVHGPMGCGKTRNAERLRRHFKCDRVQDGWVGAEPIQRGALVLTYLAPSEIAQHSRGPLVVSFDFAMRQLSKHAGA